VMGVSSKDNEMFLLFRKSIESSYCPVKYQDATSIKVPCAPVSSFSPCESLWKLT
jgi:hypothetical protein